MVNVWGWSAKSVALAAEGAIVRLEPEEEARPTTDFLARYVVGCDGAHVLGRESVGIGRRGARCDQRMVLAVFRSCAVPEALQRFPPRTTYRVLKPELRDYWPFFGRMDVGEGRVFHAPVGERVRDEADVAEVLYHAAGFPFPVAFDDVGLGGPGRGGGRGLPIRAAPNGRIRTMIQRA
ncbi:MAG: FAD-dependent monooxygenase [Firmicutes bacterium]|nr:FAD-dependent monooxygenase [Alicyclobacillaceae bacterium]MCL6496719.1 FAD-dependent monooxygenase [Bacillota bacterium]